MSFLSLLSLYVLLQDKTIAHYHKKKKKTYCYTFVWSRLSYCFEIKEMETMKI